ncbi:MAG TPA: MlaD family protein [Planctomycetota bacterium]|nr:MlaD family protein [Planctomycetota bacterium]
MSASKEFLVGAIFLIAVTILGVFTIIVSDYIPFRPQIGWRVKFDNVRGLKEGDEVRASGVKIGKVKTLELVDGKVLVTLLLRRKIPYYEDGRIMIENVTPLGGKFVNIEPGNPPKRVDTKQILRGETPPEDVATALNKLVKDIREGPGTIPRLIRDGAIYDDIKGITGDIRGLAGDIKAGKGLVGKLAGPDSEKVYADLESIVGSIRDATDQLAAKKGTLGRIIYDDALYAQIDATTKSIQGIAEDIRAGKGTLGKLVTNEQLYNNVAGIAESIKSGEGVLGKLVADKKLAKDVEQIVENVGTITTSISKGEGTLGALVNDKQFYADAVKTMAALRATTEKISSGEGTVGKLIYDQTLYTKIDRLVMELTEAAEDVREAAPITAFATLLLAGFR